MKPKKNYTPGPMDQCQTPAYALKPLLRYIPGGNPIIWEPAKGDGYLVDALTKPHYSVIGTDILGGLDFFTYQPEQWDILITNPPYGLKYNWLARCYELGKPFALIVPVEMLGAGTAQALFAKFGIQVLLLDHRVNFKMPNKGWDGQAQFPTCWITWKFNLPSDLMFGHIDPKGPR